MSRISIIVPVYNVEQYIERCIESIVNQSFSDLEIILVNDGSTDDSGIICESYARKDKRIRVINKKNGGLSSARNIGLDNITGEYLMFVDGDDFIERNMVEKLYSFMKKNNVACCVGGYQTVTESGDVIQIYKSCNMQIMSGIEALDWHYTKKVSLFNLVCVWGKLYKSSIWTNIRFRENLIYEDIDVMPEIFLKIEKLLIISSSDYNYVQRSNSIMHTMEKNRTKYYKDAIEILERHIELYEKSGLKKLKNEVIKILLDKIITHNLYNSDTKDIQKYSKIKYKKYFSKADYYYIGNYNLIRYLVYYIGGSRLYAYFAQKI